MQLGYFKQASFQEVGVFIDGEKVGGCSWSSKDSSPLILVKAPNEDSPSDYIPSNSYVLAVSIGQYSYFIRNSAIFPTTIEIKRKDEAQSNIFLDLPTKYGIA